MRNILILSLTVCLTGCIATTTQPKTSPPIVLATQKGELEVPTSGALSDAEMTRTAYQLSKTKSKIQHFTKSSEEVKLAIAAIAQELYNEATGNLDLAIRIAKRTSSALDQKKIDAARDNTVMLNTLLETPPPPSLYVSTQIDMDVVGASLHYKITGDYLRSRGNWESYTYNQTMRIGRYAFRVLPCEGNEDGFVEHLLILSDPTRKNIHTICGQ